MRKISLLLTTTFVSFLLSSAVNASDLEEESLYRVSHSAVSYNLSLANSSKANMKEKKKHLMNAIKAVESYKENCLSFDTTIPSTNETRATHSLILYNLAGGAWANLSEQYTWEGETSIRNISLTDTRELEKAIYAIKGSIFYYEKAIQESENIQMTEGPLQSMLDLIRSRLVIQYNNIFQVVTDHDKREGYLKKAQSIVTLFYRQDPNSSYYVSGKQTIGAMRFIEDGFKDIALDALSEADRIRCSKSILAASDPNKINSSSSHPYNLTESESKLMGDDEDIGKENQVGELIKGQSKKNGTSETPIVHKDLS